MNIVNQTGIPQYPKNLPIWCCWRYETIEALTWLLDTYMRCPTPSTPAVASPGKSQYSQR